MEKVQATLQRTKRKHQVIFSTPIIGKTKVKVVGYDWKNHEGIKIASDGDVVETLVSDWESAAINIETGRNIVHWFIILRENGIKEVVSAETAAQLLDVSSSKIRTSSKRHLEKTLLVQKKQKQQELFESKINLSDWYETPEEACENVEFRFSSSKRRLKENKNWKTNSHPHFLREQTMQFAKKDGKFRLVQFSSYPDFPKSFSLIRLRNDEIWK